MEKAQTPQERDKSLQECHDRGNQLSAEVHRLQGRLATATQVALGLGGALVLATGALIGSWVTGKKRTE